jgi:hypothetical protein
VDNESGMSSLLRVSDAGWLIDGFFAFGALSGVHGDCCSSGNRAINRFDPPTLYSRMVVGRSERKEMKSGFHVRGSHDEA